MPPPSHRYLVIQVASALEFQDSTKDICIYNLTNMTMIDIINKCHDDRSIITAWGLRIRSHETL